MRTRYEIELGPIRIRIVSRELEAIRRAAEWLAQTVNAAVQPAAGNLQVTLISYAANDKVPFPIPAEAVLLSRSERSAWYELGGLWIVVLQTAIWIVNPTLGRMVAHVHTSDLTNADVVEDFMQPVQEVLRFLGHDSCDAAVGLVDGRTLLVTGAERSWRDELAELCKSNNVTLLAGERYMLYADARLDRLAAVIIAELQPGKEVSEIRRLSQGEAVLAMLSLTVRGFSRESNQARLRYASRIGAGTAVYRAALGVDARQREEAVSQWLDAIRLETTASNDHPDHRYSSP